MCVVDKNEYYVIYNKASKATVSRYKNGEYSDYGTTTSFPDASSIKSDIAIDPSSNTLYIAFAKSTNDTIYTYKKAPADIDWDLVNKLPKPVSNFSNAVRLVFNTNANALFMSFANSSSKIYLYKLNGATWTDLTGSTSMEYHFNFDLSSNGNKVIITTGSSSWNIRVKVFSYDIIASNFTIFPDYTPLDDYCNFLTTAYSPSTDEYYTFFGDGNNLNAKVIKSTGGGAWSDASTGLPSDKVSNGSYSTKITYNETKQEFCLFYANTATSIIKGFYLTGGTWTNMSIPSMPATNVLATTNYKDSYFLSQQYNNNQIGIWSVNETPLTNSTNIIATPAQLYCGIEIQNRTSGNMVAVFVKQANVYDTPTPVDGTTYNGNTTFGAGAQIGTSGWYCVYNNIGDNFNITGLIAGTTYQLQAFEYNGLPGTEMYSASTELTGNPIEFTTLAKYNQVITFNPLSDKTYGDSPSTLSATGGGSGNPVTFTSSDPAVATCTGTNGETLTIINTGYVEITANQAGNASYEDAAPVTRSFSILQKHIFITNAGVAAKTYDGNTDATLLGSDLDGVVPGDDVSVNPGAGAFYNPNAGVNKPVVIVTPYVLSGQDNYKYILDQPSGLIGLINVKQITVTADAVSKYYGEETPDLTYTCDPDLFLGDHLTGSLTRAAGEDVGVYPISIGSLNGSPNYDITDFVSNNLTITKADAVIDITDVIKTFNGNPQGPTVTLTPPSVIHTIVYDSNGVSLAGMPTKPGGYHITVTITDPNFNYLLSMQGFVINKANLSFIISDTVKTYNGSAQSPTIATIPANVRVLIQSAHTDAGTYLVNISSDSSNYEGDTTTHLIINKANQSIATPDSYSKDYGDPKFPTTATASSQLPLSYSSVKGIVTFNQDSIIIVSAGHDTIFINQVGNNNYNPAPQDTAIIVIAKATLTATADEKSKPQGSPNPPLTISYSGFVYEDTITDISVLPIAVTTAITTSPAGNYPITVSGGADTNYSFIYVSSVLHITPTAPVVFTDTATSITQSTAVSGGTITSQGLTITSRGVCYSNTINPTINNGVTYSGSGDGHFTCDITGLSSNIKYYIRAFAISGADVFYGDELSFTTMNVGISENEADKYSIYPNPIDNSFTVEGANITKVMVTDINGRIIKLIKDINMQKIVVELPSIPVGIYMVKIFNNDNFTVKKIVKQ